MSFTYFQVALMDLVPSDKAKNMKAAIWETYQNIVEKAEEKKVRLLLNCF